MTLEFIIVMSAISQLRGALHFLHLASPSPEVLAGFYRDALSMQVEKHDDRWICRGPDRRLVISAGPKGGLLEAGYSVDQTVLEGLSHRLRAAGIEFFRRGASFFDGRALSFKDPDGNTLTFGVAASDTSALPGLKARLQHVVVASTDAPRMTAFYRDIVGFRESDRVLDDQGDVRTVFLHSDHEHHSFAVFKANKCRLDHHCYEAGDWLLLRDWGDWFAERGIPLRWGPGRHGPGNNLFLFVHDPDGNWVEISAELETVSEDRPVGHWPHAERTLNLWGQAYLRS